jgi:hypothetical protein
LSFPILLCFFPLSPLSVFFSFLSHVRSFFSLSLFSSFIPLFRLYL